MWSVSKDPALTKANGIISLKRVLSYGRFDEVLMIGIRDVFFQSGLNRVASFTNIGFAKGAWALINSLWKKWISFVFILW